MLYKSVYGLFVFLYFFWQMLAVFTIYLLLELLDFSEVLYLIAYVLVIKAAFLRTFFHIDKSSICLFVTAETFLRLSKPFPFVGVTFFANYTEAIYNVNSSFFITPLAQMYRNRVLAGHLKKSKNYKNPWYLWINVFYSLQSFFYLINENINYRNL